LAKATATAAIVPVCTTRNCDHPKENDSWAIRFSEKNIWSARWGIIAAISARHNAPVMVISPARAQATISQPGDPSKREDSDETMKIPLPIIDPTTIVTPSKSLSLEQAI
jgi:hypothetical protein